MELAGIGFVKKEYSGQKKDSTGTNTRETCRNLSGNWLIGGGLCILLKESRIENGGVFA